MIKEETGENGENEAKRNGCREKRRRRKIWRRRKRKQKEISPANKEE